MLVVSESISSASRRLRERDVLRGRLLNLRSMNGTERGFLYAQHAHAPIAYSTRSWQLVRNEWRRIQRTRRIRIYDGRRFLFTGPYDIEHHHDYMQRPRYNEVQALHFAPEILRRRRERRRELWRSYVLDVLLDSDSDSDESDDDVDGGQLVAEDYVNDFDGE